MKLKCKFSFLGWSQQIIAPHFPHLTPFTMDCSPEKSCGLAYVVTARQVASSGISVMCDLLVMMDLAGN